MASATSKRMIFAGDTVVDPLLYTAPFGNEGLTPNLIGDALRI